MSKRIIFFGAVCAAFVVAAWGIDAFGARVANMSGITVSANAPRFCVVLDAGHGGYDGGASRSGIKESDINFKIVRYLETELLSRGIAVVLTRTNFDTLASPYAKNKKRDDMEKRLAIIKKTSPNLFVSIHLNALAGNSSARGLQCFYGKEREGDKVFAQGIQDEVNKSKLLTNRNPRTQEFYFFDNAVCPSVLVECGFLSNPAEAKLLATKEYQQVLAFHIAVGIVKTLNA
ncbi:MAG: N-acetylmuramoyl-L-alanine amidase [Christensenellaceae bacterium]|jgi:N-acetylmuramoyl-L-alanine amidase|nr:N-acetylmuramoyl-L-alanine amidase [Christensenellaceae bacterium]